MIDNKERFKRREGTYFRCVQPYQHHKGAFLQGREPLIETIQYGGFYVYSFALKPEEYQPSGSCNLSRVSNATLSCSLFIGFTEIIETQMCFFFARNYNILRIMGGMGGIAFTT